MHYKQKQESGHIFVLPHVSMRNKKGWSKPSEEAYVLERDLIPSVPVDLQVMCDKSGAREMNLDQQDSQMHADMSLTFKWKPPHVHTNRVKDYEFKIRRKGTVQWSVGTSEDTSLTVTLMQPKTKYEYQIRAQSSTHVNGEAIEGEVCTEAACPCQPKKPSLHITSSQKVELSIDKLKTEAENGEPVTHMRIEKSQDQNTWEPLDPIEIGEDSNIKVETGLCTTNTKNDVVTYFYYRVSMKNEKGWSEPSENAKLDKNKLIPSAPENLQVMRDKCGPREIWLMWTKPLFHAHKIKQYSVIVNVDNNCKVFWCNHESVSFAIPDVIPNASYQISVQSLNIYEKGECSKPVSHTTPYAPPNPPLVKSIQTKSSNESELHIQLPKLQRGEKPVTHIIVEKSDDSVQWAHAMEKQIMFSENKEISLVLAYSSHMRVLFKNDVGISEPCEPIKIPTEEFIPGIPMNLRKTKLTSTTVTFCWEKPQANAPAAKKYAIQMKNTTEKSWKTLYSVHEMKNEITGLTPSSTFEVRVCAENDKRVGDYCEPCKFTTLPKTPQCPGIRMIDCRSANVIIQKFDFKGGTKMNIEACRAENEWELLVTVTPEEAEYNAKNPQEYSYTVQLPGMLMCLRSQLFNEELASEYSDVTELTAKDFIPGPPTQLKVRERTSSSITIVWKEPKGDQHPQSVAYYEIVVIAIEDKFERKGNKCGAEKCELTITKLTMATTYNFQVYALNEQQEKGGCASIKVETLYPTPGPPINLRLAGATQSRIKVRWCPPTQNAFAVEKYELCYRASDTDSAFETFAIYESKKTSAVVRELQVGTNYDFKLCSINKNGQRSEEVECPQLSTKGGRSAMSTLISAVTFGYVHRKEDDDDVNESP